MNRMEKIVREFVSAGRHAGEWVIQECKLSKNARKTFFGFQNKVNQDISGEWYMQEDGSYTRAVGILKKINGEIETKLI